MNKIRGVVRARNLQPTVSFSLLLVPLSSKCSLTIDFVKKTFESELKRRSLNSADFTIKSHRFGSKVEKINRKNLLHYGADKALVPHGFDGFGEIIVSGPNKLLSDPWGLLKAITARFAESGVAVFAAMNREKRNSVSGLSSGDLNSASSGGGIRAHLRLFTLAKAPPFIEPSGVIPHDASSEMPGGDECTTLGQAMEPTPATSGVIVAEDSDLSSSSRSDRHPMAVPGPRMNILSTALPAVGGVSQVRIHEPMDALRALPDVNALVISNSQLPSLDKASPKIFIFHRPLLVGESGLAPIRQLLALGYVIVCEFDDHPDFIPALREPDTHNFRSVHAVQTTTLQLASVIGDENSDVRVFPNCIARLPEPSHLQTPGILKILFGGINRQAEWPEYIDKINEAIGITRDRLHFEVIHDEGFYRALKTQNKKYTPLCNYDEYKNILSQCDVCFMPLSDTPFNRCKSDLKFLEASSFSVASLASPTVYRGTVKDGENGIIFGSPNELYQKLLSMAANPERVRAIGRNSFDYVKDHRMLSQQSFDRLSWYREIWEQRHLLMSAITSRTPELGHSGTPE